MSQKILATHTEDSWLGRDFVELRVDQVVLAREPNRVLGEAVERGLRRSQVEVSVAYPPHCIARGPLDVDPRAPHGVHPDAIQLGFLIAQPGAGFATAVHLERFGSPARVLLTDEPRLSNAGGASMLTLTASTPQLAEALLAGKVLVRTPSSIQISLTGRLRPFVCLRDVSLELLRRGLGELVRDVDRKTGAPVILEFAGPSTRLLSVGDRAVLGDVAARLGAAGVLFPSDEKTEIFLRDQKRSKAHRVLAADAGAEFDAHFTLDVGAVDPLVLDEDGKVRPVRDLDGRAVSQVLLGGDSGCSLRDLLAAAALLKSKRVPPRVEFLLAPPSRQTLEVLARSDALVDLIATGVRLIEPDRRSLWGELYPARPFGVALRNADPEVSQTASPGLVASAETLAYAVAHGEIGDPRYFKRPVRVTVPRTLPTDDVLLARGQEARGGAKGKGRVDKKAADASEAPSSRNFVSPRTRGDLVETNELALVAGRSFIDSPSALVTRDVADAFWLTETAAHTPGLRCLLAPHVPASIAVVLSGAGVIVLRVTEEDALTLVTLAREKPALLFVPAPHHFPDAPTRLEARVGHHVAHAFDAEWLARGGERRTFEAHFTPASREMRTRDARPNGTSVDRKASSRDGD